MNIIELPVTKDSIAAYKWLKSATSKDTIKPVLNRVAWFDGRLWATDNHRAHGLAGVDVNAMNGDMFSLHVDKERAFLTGPEEIGTFPNVLSLLGGSLEPVSRWIGEPGRPLDISYARLVKALPDSVTLNYVFVKEAVAIKGIEAACLQNPDNPMTPVHFKFESGPFDFLALVMPVKLA